MYATYGKGDAVNSVYCTVFIRRVECAAGHVHTERDLRHVRMSHVAFKQCLSATQFMHLCCLCFMFCCLFRNRHASISSAFFSQQAPTWVGGTGKSGRKGERERVRKMY